MGNVLTMKPTIQRWATVLVFNTIVFLAPVFGQNKEVNEVLAISKKVADWQLDEWKTNNMQWPKWDWTNAVCYAGIYAYYDVSKEQRYGDILMDIANATNWKNGPNRSYADEYCVAQLYCQLYKEHKQEKMIADFKSLANRLMEVPHTESIAWENKIFLREWAWCDALFMGPPSFAFLSSVTRQIQYLDFASKMWWQTTDYLFDTTTNLFLRDSRFFTKKGEDGNKIYWSRGNGWVMAGLCRMIQNLPPNYKDEQKYVSLFQKMAAAVSKVQRTDGYWPTSLLDSVHYKQQEASGTAFLCYALTFGVRNGLLNSDEYRPVIDRAWNALIKMVHPDGKLGYVQKIGDAPGHVAYNDTEVYGVGAFLLAGAERVKLLNGDVKKRTTE